MKTNKYNQGGRTAMYDMLRKYMEGGKMYANGGVDGDPEKETEKEKAYRLMKGLQERNRAVEAKSFGGGEGGGTSTSQVMPGLGAIESLMGNREETEETSLRGEDLSPIRPRGLRSIKNDRERPGIKGNTQGIPKKAPSTDYSLRPIVRGGGSGIYTEASNKGVMGVAGRGKDGKERYFYLPEITSQPGFSKGSYQKQTQGALKDIRSEFGEDAFMEALGMLEKRGVDISPYVD